MGLSHLHPKHLARKNRETTKRPRSAVDVPCTLFPNTTQLSKLGVGHLAMNIMDDQHSLSRHVISPPDANLQ